ncbi:recombinase family protein [Novosphingobium flavum]|uniref:Recombinase family protein n=1 Tax=Novosphingobium flavum TaxID=1778672 RepID=A0A7X1KMU6_9SPHN|nr:recombinase family protein [Novosphingobium flavum]MBC2666972.1 recombinase family protein [Novosphingobium flavum]
MAVSPPKRLRCAVYTRKSTEEGLDQAFNSLDAQREACAAYVMSQRHEGWTLLPDSYDDGGFTGGNMERPGLQQLLADVRASRVDVVVVYKVDRLTRSLADFAKIVEVLDNAGVSFVSVTQAFNTTNSMGRLTLNVLLSFAQFEREVIAERIRDKVAASKARGMWMGGPLPLGYKAEDRKLMVVPDEAGTVREIMRRYLAAPNIMDLLDELRRDGIVSKKLKLRDGSIRGGIPFRRGALHHLLSNRIYVGETVHKDKVYPGQHEAIIDRELFDAVQAKLAGRTNTPLAPGARRRVSLLAGLIRDEQGRPMSPVHTFNHGWRYSYYASNLGDGSKEAALRLPAGELDQAVRAELVAFLTDVHRIRDVAIDQSPDDQVNLVASFAVLASNIESMAIGELRHLLQRIELTVIVSRDNAAAQFDLPALTAWVGLEIDHPQPFALPLSTTTVAWGHEARLRLDPPAGKKVEADPNLVQLIARGFAARDELLAMSPEQAAAMPVTTFRHTERIARLAYLAPDIIRAILDGHQPRRVTARYLSRLGALPLSWTAQREMLGFAAARPSVFNF